MKKISFGALLITFVVGVFLTLSGSSRPDTQPLPEALSGQPSSTAEVPPNSTSDGLSEVTKPEGSPVHTKSVFMDYRQGGLVLGADGKTYPLRQYKAMLTPNDPSGTQWWTDKTSLNHSWDIGTGSKQTLLAVIDTGFALEHEEFTGRWHENTGEKGTVGSEQASRLNCSDRGLALNKSCNLLDDNFDGIIDNETGATSFENQSLLNCTDQTKQLDKSCNLIDDDGNGLVDDWRGWDFSSLDRSVQAGEVAPGASSVGHGTMAAGVAAATGNNGNGISGVDWYTKILPLQALDDEGDGNTLTVSRAIRYAADQGADVISLSLGSEFEDSYMREAVHYAIKKGSVVVAASGNDGCECISYPARYPEVIAVGASDQNDLPTYFSNWGENLDILAPGIGMTSPTWHSDSATAAYASNIAGTSFATPLVAGLLTRARSYQPNATSQQLLASISEQTNRLTIPAGTAHTTSLGFGRVNAQAAMLRVTSVMQPIQRTVLGDVSGGAKLGSFESQKPFMLYQCEAGRPGTTKLYRLVKGSSVVYTISEVERQQGLSQGYGAALVGSHCLNLPSDFPQVVRSLSLFQELENRTPKE